MKTKITKLTSLGMMTCALLGSVANAKSSIECIAMTPGQDRVHLSAEIESNTELKSVVFEKVNVTTGKIDETRKYASMVSENSSIESGYISNKTPLNEFRFENDVLLNDSFYMPKDLLNVSRFQNDYWVTSTNNQHAERVNLYCVVNHE